MKLRMLCLFNICFYGYSITCLIPVRNLAYTGMEPGGYSWYLSLAANVNKINSGMEGGGYKKKHWLKQGAIPAAAKLTGIT